MDELVVCTDASGHIVVLCTQTEIYYQYNSKSEELNYSIEEMFFLVRLK